MPAQKFVRMLAVAELPPGGGVPIEVGDQTIAVFNVDGTFHAVDNQCPHQGGSLADGALLCSTVVCPLHHWQFGLADGKNPVNPDLCVRSFPAEVREGSVWVDVGEIGT